MLPDPDTETWLRDALESAPMAMLVLDPEGRIAFANAAAEACLGYAPRELVGLDVECLLNASDRTVHRSHRARFTREPKQRMMGGGRVFRGVRKDGDELALEIGLSPLPSTNAHYVLACMQDVTMRERLEVALRASEARYRSVVDNIPDGFYMTDSDGRIKRVNAAYCSMSGYSADELLCMSVDALLGVPPARDHARRLAQILHWGRYRFQTQHRSKNARVWPAEITINAIPALNEYFVIIRDLTQLKALQAEQQAAEAVIRDWAFRDPLTTLPNRRLLADRLERTIAASARGGEFAAVLYVDMDRFKQLNDQSGHAAGDQFLCQVARRLAGAVRDQDTVARVGGDEFVVMILGLSVDRDAAMRKLRTFADKLAARLLDPYELDDGTVHRSTASIGATLFGARSEAGDILRTADEAMYRVKSQGGGGVCIVGDRDTQQAA